MYRYLAHITLECKTPLAIASGQENVYTDAPVQRDFNGLPVIPWTSIKGALRTQALDGLQNYFGSKDADAPQGARYIGSDAFLMNADGKVQTTLVQDVFADTEVYSYYKILPTRQHVRIDHLGTAMDKSLFSNSVVYKGSRFKLEVKLEIDEDVDEDWKKLLSLFYHPHFRLGSQVTNGLGVIEVVAIDQRKFDLSNSDDFSDFIAHTPKLKSLNGSSPFSEPSNEVLKAEKEERTFEFSTDAIHIGSGYGDADTDHANLVEDVLVWDTHDKPHWQSKKEAQNLVIPGASIKGVLRHRTAFYLCPPLDWEQQKSKDEEISNQDTDVGNNAFLHDYLLEHTQKAIVKLFGQESGAAGGGSVGNLYVEDVFVAKKDYKESLFMHNVIDRFTQGTVTNLLFSERVAAVNKAVLRITIKDYKMLKKNCPNVIEAFEKAWEDLTNGLLAIGGNTTNGNGFLTKSEQNATE